MTKGWKHEPGRHGLAARGIKTASFKSEWSPHLGKFQDSFPGIYKLDPGIKKYLQIINSNYGLATFSSCAGHPKRGEFNVHSYAWIAIIAASPEIAEYWMKKSSKYFDIEYESYWNKMEFAIMPKNVHKKSQVRQWVPGITFYSQVPVSNPNKDPEAANAEFFKNVETVFRRKP